VRDAQDAPVQGVVVIFKVVENNGTVSDAGETDHVGGQNSCELTGDVLLRHAPPQRPG
jgi:hypothetical protein